MKENEARDILSILKAATVARLHADEDEFWLAALLPLDADFASRAVFAGIREWTRMPSWAQFKEAYGVQRKLAEPDVTYALRPAADKGIPEWVRRWVAARWLYARFGREQDMRWFPEQADFVDTSTEKMPEDEWVQEAARITDREVWRALVT
jgi:hypothetical protein